MFVNTCINCLHQHVSRFKNKTKVNSKTLITHPPHYTLIILLNLVISELLQYERGHDTQCHLYLSYYTFSYLIKHFLVQKKRDLVFFLYCHLSGQIFSDNLSKLADNQQHLSKLADSQRQIIQFGRLIVTISILADYKGQTSKLADYQYLGICQFGTKTKTKIYPNWQIISNK